LRRGKDLTAFACAKEQADVRYNVVPFKLEEK
jgi:hypothetical protein